MLQYFFIKLSQIIYYPATHAYANRMHFRKDMNNANLQETERCKALVGQMNDQIFHNFHLKQIQDLSRFSAN